MIEGKELAFNFICLREYRGEIESAFEKLSLPISIYEWKLVDGNESPCLRVEGNCGRGQDKQIARSLAEQNITSLTRETLVHFRDPLKTRKIAENIIEGFGWTIPVRSTLQIIEED